MAFGGIAYILGFNQNPSNQGVVPGIGGGPGNTLQSPLVTESPSSTETPLPTESPLPTETPLPTESPTVSPVTY